MYAQPCLLVVFQTVPLSQCLYYTVLARNVLQIVLSLRRNDEGHHLYATGATCLEKQKKKTAKKAHAKRSAATSEEVLRRQRPYLLRVAESGAAV
nr:unnamed protein product [Callosobruchus chinensis]